MRCGGWKRLERVTVDIWNSEGGVGFVLEFEVIAWYFNEAK